jgi:hypothetical protein
MRGPAMSKGVSKRNSNTAKTGSLLSILLHPAFEWKNKQVRVSKSPIQALGFRILKDNESPGFSRNICALRKAGLVFRLFGLSASLNQSQ